MADHVVAGSLAELLLQNGLVTEEQLEEANRRRRDEDKTLGRVLVEMGALDEKQKMSLLKQRFNCEIVSIEDFRIDPRTLRLLPRSFCERHMVAPLMREKNALILAMEDPSDIVVLDEARSLSGLEPRPVVAACAEILQALKQRDGDDGAALPAAPPPPLWLRIVRYSAFPILCFLPLAVFMGFLMKMDQLQLYIFTRLDFFELFLYTFLLWGLWAVVLWYINQMIFPPPGEE